MVLEVVTEPLLVGMLSLIGWTARELYRTSKNQTALEHRVKQNENKIESIFEEL